MASKTPSAPADKKPPFVFSYHSIRTLPSAGSETAHKVYVGNCRLSEILDLNTDENVREFIPDAGKRRRLSGVHWAIWDTLENRPEDFQYLNGGIVIVARGVKVDDKKRQAILVNPSIINGAQTQGTIRRFVEEKEELPETEGGHEPLIKFELIVTSDEDLIADVSIARNFQQDVKPISITGSKGRLSELDSALQKRYPAYRLRSSETDMVYDDNNIVDTERLLQVLAVMAPESLRLKTGFAARVSAYRHRAKILKEFDEIWSVVHEKPDHPDYARYEALYQFYLDTVADAHDLYYAWKRDGYGAIGGLGWKKGISRTKTDRGKKEIADVADGIVFPILASYSVFAKQIDGAWVFEIPEGYERFIASRAQSEFMNVADHNPNVMGKHKACYESLTAMAIAAQTSPAVMAALSK